MYIILWRMIHKWKRIHQRSTRMYRINYNVNVIIIAKSVSYDQTEWLISTISEFCNTCIHYMQVLVRFKQFYLFKLFAMPKNQLSRLHLLCFCKNITPILVYQSLTRERCTLHSNAPSGRDCYFTSFIVHEYSNWIRIKIIVHVHETSGKIVWSKLMYVT